MNSGAVSFDGISCSKKLSISAWSVIHQRGKNVVSVSSGNTTTSQPMRLPSRRWATSRSTTSRREWLRWIGPICAAPTVRTLLIADPHDALAWSVGLRAPHTFLRLIASSAPVRELRQNNRPFWPDSSRAFTVRPSSSLISEPAVT